MPDPNLREAVLDTVAIRVMAFAHPQGIDIAVQGLVVPLLRLPAEVYNRDENALPLDDDDRHLSELARGLRVARRQIDASVADIRRYETWLAHAAQLTRHLDAGTMLIDELPPRGGGDPRSLADEICVGSWRGSRARADQSRAGNDRIRLL